MNIKVSDALSVIEGLEPIDPALLEKFKRAMTEDAIPKIVSAVEKRQIQAAKTREWHLKSWPAAPMTQPQIHFICFQGKGASRAI